MGELNLDMKDSSRTIQGHVTQVYCLVEVWFEVVLHPD